MISGSVWNSLQQQPRQPDRLLAERRAGRRLAAVGRIALVEDQIDHGGDGGEPLRALDRARRLERHAGIGDARLGAGDALLHGAFADQEGARDLLDGEAGDDAQRHRDLLRRRQVGMAADEQQPQDVVAVMRAVQPLGDIALGIFQVGDLVLLRHRRLLGALAHRVDAAVAADKDQPGRRVARRPVLRPVLQCPEARILESFLRRIEIAEVAQQRAHRLRAGGC